MSLKAEVRQKLINSLLHQIDDDNFNAAALCAEYGVSRQTVQRYINKLLEEKIIEQEGNSKPRRYRLCILSNGRYEYINQDLDEYSVWKADIAPGMSRLNKTAYDKIEYIFCEMMNNAIHHSETKKIIVTWGITAITAMLIIRDEGVGIFAKVQQAMGLTEKRFALLELYKGKFTTDPQKHTGEGVFFSSRAADFFSIKSDGLCYFYNSGDEENQDFLLEKNDKPNSGTVIYAEVYIDSPVTLEDVFQEYTEHPDHIGFNRTIVPVKMLEYGEDSAVFVSRSQARRLLARFERFDNVVLDFTGVEAIRQGFADEVFRVFINEHPGCHIEYINANEQVKKMILFVKGTK